MEWWSGKEWTQQVKNREIWENLEEAYTQLRVPVKENNAKEDHSNGPGDNK